MITVHMMGNIGNQLFIYAFARALQLEYKQPLLIDLIGLKRGYYSASYKLDQFALNDDLVYGLENLGFFSKFFYQITSRIYHLQHYYYRYKKNQMYHPKEISKGWFRWGCYYNTNHDYYEYNHKNHS